MALTMDDVVFLTTAPGGRERVVELLAALTEAERIALRRELKPWFDDWRWGAQITATRQRGAREDREVFDSAVPNLVALGCAGGPRQAARWLQSTEWLQSTGFTLTGYPELVVRVVQDRAPSWSGALVEELTRTHTWSGWPLVDGLVTAGLGRMPSIPEAVELMVNAPSAMSSRGGSVSALAFVRLYPHLLADLVWRLFDTERIGRTLSTTDEWATHTWDPATRTRTETLTDHSWTAALIELAATGEIDRSRLLAATLRALANDWAATDLRWYLDLHERLAPTPAEVAAHQGEYIRLLTADYGRVVAMAQKRLGALIAPRLLDAQAVIAASTGPLTAPTKSAALAQVRLLRRIATAWPDTAGQVAQVAAVAIEHSHVDVREAAQALVGPVEAAPADAGVPAEVEAAVVPEPVPEPVPARRFVPITDPAELLDIAAGCVSTQNADTDPLAVERLVDAVVRFADARPAGWEAVLSTAQMWSGTWGGGSVVPDVAGIVRLWLGDRTVPDTHGKVSRSPFRRPDHRLTSSISGWSSLRLREIALLVADGGGPVLATPSFEDATIDPEELAARVEAIGTGTVGPYDLALAALRCRPVDDTWLGRLPHTPVGQDVRAAITQVRAFDPIWEPVVVTSVGWDAVWAMTWRVAGQSSQARSSDTTNTLVTTLLWVRAQGHERHAGLGHDRYGPSASGWPWLAPHRPDVVAARLHAPLATISGSDELNAALAWLGHAGTGSPVVCSALVLGLNSAHLTTRLTAVDALADLAARRVLDAAILAGEIQRLLTARILQKGAPTTGLVVGKRIVEGLAEVARASGAAELLVREALAAALAAFVGRRDAHLAVNLLAQVSATTPVPASAIPPEFATLAAGTSRTALAKAVRRVRVDASSSA